MKCAVFSTKSYDEEYLSRYGNGDIEWNFFSSQLHPNTVPLAEDHGAVCVFVNDELSRQTLRLLDEFDCKLIALRCAGFNNVDLEAADELGFTVSRVPAYSPHAVAEHTVALIQTLNRKTHKAYNRVREANFSIEGLMGKDLRPRTVGIIGTGTIGTEFARIMAGFGCELLGHDPNPNDACRDLGLRYVGTEELYNQSDIISLHLPLTPETKNLIDAWAITQMKDDVMLINTSRGKLIDTRAVIEALKKERIGALGIDVYEQEEHLFFRDMSGEIIQDDVFSRLLTFPNVLITAHQGFFTREAMEAIAETTAENIRAYEEGSPQNVVRPE